MTGPREFELVDRETGEAMPARGGRVCRPMRRFALGDVSPDEWVSLPEVTVAEGARQPWPVAARFRGRFRACEAREAEPIPERPRPCSHPSVTRGLCSDGCAASKGAAPPLDHGDPSNPFLAHACRFCHAALVNKCDACRAMVR